MRHGSNGLGRRLRGGWLGAAKRLLGVALGLSASLVTLEASAASPFLEVPLREEVEQTPAFRYAQMTNEEAFAELDRRGILYTKLGAVHGVRAPIRLTGRLHGVLVRSSLPPEERATTPFEILDARLALAIDDFAVLLAKHDVEELIHYTMYRPNVPPPQAAGARPVQPVAATKPAASTPEATKDAPRAAAPTSKPEGRRATATRPASAKRRASAPAKPTKAAKPEKGSAIAPTSKHKRPAEEELALDPLGELDHACDHDHGDASLEVADEAAKSARPAKRAAGASPRPSAAKPPQPAKSAARGGASSQPARAQKLRAVAVLDEKPHGKWAPPGTRHPAGLAIDVGALVKRDGRVLSIASHFRGKIGERTCGQGAPVPETAEARELREIVCGAREAGVFTYALTPNYDAPHFDHLHLEIKPGVAWFLYH